jgi:hypothetical protein
LRLYDKENKDCEGDKICKQALLLNGKCWCPAKQANPYIPVQRKQVTRGFIFVFIYMELSQIYKSIFKLNIKGNSHIVQVERKLISCESPLAWRRLDAAWMQLCL